MLGNKIHKAILNEPVFVEFYNKKGKVKFKFKVGLLSLKEVVQISKVAYNINLPDRKDIGVIHEIVVKNYSKIVSIIAIMIKSRTWVPTWIIRIIIMRYTNSDSLVKLIGLVYDAMSVKSFMNSITLLTGVSLIKKEEIIASMKKMESQS